MSATMARPRFYLRATDAETVAAAARLGADGVSFDLRLDGSRGITVGRDALETVLGLAHDLDLCVDLVAGSPLTTSRASTLIAATVASLVSSHGIRSSVRLSSFDHASLATIGRGVDDLAVGLRHLVTLHEGEQYASRVGAAVLHPLAGEVSTADVERARALGVLTHAWTLDLDFWPVDEATQLDHAIAQGVDAVTFTSAALLATRKDTR